MKTQIKDIALAFSEGTAGDRLFLGYGLFHIAASCAALVAFALHC